MSEVVTDGMSIDNVEVITVVDERTQATVVGVGFKGDQGEPGSATEDYVADEAISAYRVVVGTGAGTVVRADNTIAGHRDRVLGVTEAAVALGAAVAIRRLGPITFSSWAWVPFAPIFVGATGLLTQTPPSSPAVFSQVIAVALSATAIYVWPREPLAII